MRSRATTWRTGNCWCLPCRFVSPGRPHVKPPMLCDERRLHATSCLYSEVRAQAGHSSDGKECTWKDCGIEDRVGLDEDVRAQLGRTVAWHIVTVVVRANQPHPCLGSAVPFPVFLRPHIAQPFPCLPPMHLMCSSRAERGFEIIDSIPDGWICELAELSLGRAIYRSPDG